MKDLDLEDFEQHISSYKEDFQPNVAAGLNRLHGRIGTDLPPKATVRRIGRPAWLGMAAAVLLLLVAGYFLFDDGKTTFQNDTNAPLAVKLPDGTGILLQQGAELSYDKDYNKTERQITLAGQAFFEVHKDNTRPFLVNTEETELRVTGTAFNLRIEAEELEVEVSEGAVELRRAGEITAVTAMHCGLSVPGQKCSLMPAENLNRHAWRTGKLSFRRTPLADAIETIVNNYDLKVSYESDCERLVTIEFTGDDPVAVLQTIALLGPGELTEVPGDGWVLEGMCD